MYGLILTLLLQNQVVSVGALEKRDLQIEKRKLTLENTVHLKTKTSKLCKKVHITTDKKLTCLP